MDDSDFVNVSIKIRPRNKEYVPCVQIISETPPVKLRIFNYETKIDWLRFQVILVPDRSQTFVFDQIFDADTSQSDVFQKTVKPLVKYVKQGYNCTVFAYGQTGTGKTFTVGTAPEVQNHTVIHMFL